MVIRRRWSFLAACSLALVACAAGSEDGTYRPPAAAACEEMGLSNCGGYCVNLLSSPDHCGECSLSCNGLFCSNGVCQSSCDQGLTACGLSCADTRTDATNCGSCSVVCGSGQACVNGSCAGVDGTGGTGGSGDTAGSGGTANSGGTSGSGGASGSGGVPGSGGTAGSGGGTLTGAWSGAVSAQAASMVQTEYTAWKAKYVQNCGSEARVIKSGEETVSEGIAYGMLLSVLAGDQDLFDRLWSYYKSRRNKNGVMNWKTGGCDPTTIWGENGATDAELDAAAALILADKRWGGYQADTTALINIIKTHETTQCNGRTVLKPGDAWGGCDRTNPSYFAPAYYRAFAAYVPQDAAFWSKFVSDSYALLSTNQAGGLPTDWCNGSGAREGDYGWEACRVPWRIAVDYGWSQDPAAVQSLQAIASAGGSIASFKDPNSCFRGGLALTGVTDQAKLDSNVTQWLANVPADDSYYQGTLRVLYLYTAAGLFVLPQ